MFILILLMSMLFIFQQKQYRKFGENENNYFYSILITISKGTKVYAYTNGFTLTTYIRTLKGEPSCSYGLSFSSQLNCYYNSTRNSCLKTYSPIHTFLNIYIHYRLCYYRFISLPGKTYDNEVQNEIVREL